VGEFPTAQLNKKEFMYKQEKREERGEEGDYHYIKRYSPKMK
jgi:hypothetical protein